MKSKILKRASKIMEIHEEVGYFPEIALGYNKQVETLKHMNHCVTLALEEALEDARIACTKTDQRVGFKKKSYK